MTLLRRLFAASSLVAFLSCFASAQTSVTVHAPEAWASQRYYPYCAVNVHSIAKFNTSVGAVS